MQLVENPKPKPFKVGKTSMQKIFEKFAMLICWAEYKDKLKNQVDAGLLSVEPVYNNELGKFQVALTFVTEEKDGSQSITPIATFLTEQDARKFQLVEDEPNGRSLVKAFYSALHKHLKKYIPTGTYNINVWNKPVVLDEFKNGVSDYV